METPKNPLLAVEKGRRPVDLDTGARLGSVLPRGRKDRRARLREVPRCVGAVMCYAGATGRVRGEPQIRRR